MIEITPIDWYVGGGISSPRDEKLHKRMVQFCRENLADYENFRPHEFTKVWVAEDHGEVLAVAGLVANRLDIPTFRSIDLRASLAMAKRINSYVADQGCRGQGVFVYLSEGEAPESQCPKREQVLEAMGAVKADRYLVTCK